jgi:hypothetical protein
MVPCLVDKIRQGFMLYITTDAINFILLRLLPCGYGVREGYAGHPKKGGG